MDEQLLATAARQDGYLTLSQVRSAGNRRRMDTRRRSGEWVQAQPSVVRAASWQPGFAARLTAARLALESAGPSNGWCFSHTTAARLWGLKVPEVDDVHVLLPMSRTKLTLVDVQQHYTRKVLRIAKVQRDPVAFLAPTVVQCAAVLPLDQLRALVEDGLRTERLSLTLLRGVCGRGTSGSAALRRLVDELETKGTDFWMRRLVRLLADRVPPPQLEVPMRDGPRIRAYLDGYLEAAKLALEVDDWETHGSRAAQERDRARDRWLYKAYGITTIRVTPREIRTKSDQVVADILSAYERGSRR